MNQMMLSVHPSAIRGLITRFAARFVSCGEEREDDCLLVGHMPWVAPRAFAFRVYDPLPPGSDLSTTHVPENYAEVLASMNGAFAFGLSLFGVPSLDGLVTRSVLRPFSLETANSDWRYEYKGGGGLFHFGGAALTPRENIGYFLDGQSAIALRKSGTVFGEWPSLLEMLQQELERSEQIARGQGKNAALFEACT